MKSCLVMLVCFFLVTEWFIRGTAIMGPGADGLVAPGGQVRQLKMSSDGSLLVVVGVVYLRPPAALDCPRLASHCQAEVPTLTR